MNKADVTQLVRRAAAGSDSAVNELLPLVYDELRAIAQSYLASERRGHTLQATALVHEAYLKLVDQSRVQWRGRSHFFAVAAQAVRRILVDHARSKGAAKRGGDRRQVELAEAVEPEGKSTVDLVALDDALHRLRHLNERQARIVELRFFAGLTIDEIAEVLSASPRTVDSDWRMARAWLRHAVSDANSA